jgi:phosphopantetheine--protein transferase-like protein
MTLYPVVMPVSGAVQRLSGHNKVAALSDCARQALRISADRTGIVLGELQKDGDDIPMPFGRYHWSISHKPKYVGAVIGTGRMGIDVEEIEPRKEAIFDYVASEEEWRLFGGKSRDSLYCCWTAKEAVVKSTGTGLAGLRSCRVVDVRDANITLLFDGRLHRVEQMRHDGHIVSVLRGDNVVEWVVLDSPATQTPGCPSDSGDCNCPVLPLPFDPRISARNLFR